MYAEQEKKITEEQLLSPCIRNCCLDNNDICLGCFRSLEEIINWSKADKQTRQHILETAEHRKQCYQQNVKF